MIKHPDEVLQMLQRAEHWPASMRIDLARRLLESVHMQEPKIESKKWTANEAMAAVNSCQPAPDDALVTQWLVEHRMEKYGR